MGWFIRVIGCGLAVLLVAALLSSCQIATMKQIRRAVKDGYVSGYLQKGVASAKLSKLSKQKKWQPYKLDCASGSPRKASGELKVPCRLGDALEQKFLALLSSCGIGNWFNGKITSIPKVLQNNLRLQRKIKAFEGVSMFRLFRYVFTRSSLREFTANSTKTRRFLKRNVLGSNLHLSSALGFNSASYRQNCNSLVNAGVKAGFNFSPLSLKSALKSQFSTQGFRELLVFQGLFTSPLHKAIQLPDNDPNRWFTQMHVWLAYKRLVGKTRGQIPALKYLKSLVGVATFQTQRSTRKVQLQASASGKGDIKFVSGSASIQAKYVGGQQFSFKGYSALIFQSAEGRGWSAEFENLPTPSTIRDEFRGVNFPISPNFSFLVPRSSYQHQLTADGLPAQLCKKSAWKLVACGTRTSRFYRGIQKQHCSGKGRRWIHKIRLEDVEHTPRSNSQPAPSCQFKISYQTQAPKDLKDRYSLRYVLVGRRRARIGKLAPCPGSAGLSWAGTQIRLSVGSRSFENRRKI